MSILNTALIQKLKKIKADKENVLELDQTTPYEPTDLYHPATKKYVDTVVYNVNIITTEKILIQENRVTLPSKCFGIVNGSAMIFDDNDAQTFAEHTCLLSGDGLYVIFDPIDNLNNKFAIISYLSKV